MRTRLLALAGAALLFLAPTFVEARGGGGHSSGHSSSRSGSSSSAHSYHSSPGTGSKSQSSSVRGYTKKDGTRVAPHRRTTPDKNFRNNYSTKGNTNPYNGKSGTRLEPPKGN